MSSFFIDKTDPQIAEILDRLKRMNKILQKTETLVQPTLNNERFLTDEELSKILTSLTPTPAPRHFWMILPKHLHWLTKSFLLTFTPHAKLTL